MKTTEEIVIQHSKELKLLFLNFLKENNALKTYKKNLISFSLKYSSLGLGLGDKINIFSCPKLSDHIVHAVIEDDKYYRYFRELINWAFCWGETPQGHEYWSKLNLEWKTKLDQFTFNAKRKYAK